MGVLLLPEQDPRVHRHCVHLLEEELSSLPSLVSPHCDDAVLLGRVGSASRERRNVRWNELDRP